MLTITNDSNNEKDGFVFRLDLGVDFAKKKVSVRAHVWDTVSKKDKKPSKVKQYSREEIVEFLKSATGGGEQKQEQDKKPESGSFNE